jgi:aminoglycoside phosphotransferase (APT) family kinase protein
MTLKTGTKIEMLDLLAMGGFPGVPAEAATIARWTKVSGPRLDGWHIVKFQSGYKLCVHSDAFRVIDNRRTA